MLYNMRNVSVEAVVTACLLCRGKVNIHVTIVSLEKANSGETWFLFINASGMHTISALILR